MDVFTSEAVVARGKDEVRKRPPEAILLGFRARKLKVVVQDLFTSEAVVVRGRDEVRKYPLKGNIGLLSENR